ncbi:MAG: carbohydrate binding family 9 domain-containing protein [Chlorobi bacterium]|nr:carbohydrate binding family 9 domain-containing protein [Chlorobiota bacterium]
MFILIISHISPLSAQINRENFRLPVRKTHQPVIIDGVLDDPCWQHADKAKDFFRILPIDTGQAKAQTIVMVSYDDETLYMGIICYDPTPGKRPVESLRRDFSFPKNDNFLVFMDTYNDYTNGFSFGVSAAGAQWDGIQANGGYVSLNWDCKWRSAVKNEPDRWVAEFAIPFHSIRYRKGSQTWGINFSRLDLKTNEKSSWAPVPRQFQSANLAFTGSMIFDEPLPPPGLQYSLIPYVMGKSSYNPQQSPVSNSGLGAGMDVKITPAPSMNLDLTFSPDYSQVEVDQQVTNLDRFELFFPEKRQFFLENSDLFANLGSETVRPFFSRRIGLNQPVIAGGRLSGNINDNNRIGLMNIQTVSSESWTPNIGSPMNTPTGNNHAENLPSNYSVAVWQHNVFSRSNITAFMVNRQLTGQAADTVPGSKYNRVAGLEYNLASEDSRWTGKFFYHRVFQESNNSDASSLAADIQYNTQQLALRLAQTWVGENYIAETGYVPRNGYYAVMPSAGYKFYPASEKLANHGPIIKGLIYYNTGLERTEHNLTAGYGFEWLNRSKLGFSVEDHYILLQKPFDPTNTGGDSLQTGTDYQWNNAILTWNSDPRNLFNIEISGGYGGYFNGTRLHFESSLNYRWQPYANFSLVSAWNRIQLPAPYTSTDLLLVGPKLDITFTDKLFFTTYVQYNNQIDNINVNLRIQWRFAPVSDLFIVYTGNSTPDGLVNQNRALVVKLSYWFH